MSETFSECESVPDGDPLRQGDVFLFDRDNGNLDAWQQAGIIVTADCDLARNKHAGLLTYVPALPLREYMAMQLVPKMTEDLLARELRKLAELVFQIEQARNTSPGLSKHAIREWVTREGGVEEMLDHLAVTNANQRKTIYDKANAINACVSARELPTFEEQLSALVALHESTPKKSATGRVIDEVRNRLKNLPGDSLFISSIGDNSSDGFIVYLRLVRELRVHQIAVSYYEKGRRGVVAKRISRMRAPYIYRLTQLLADVFSAIGLPEEYEHVRDTAFESCLSTAALAKVE
ncbi:MAG: hypothetical protein JXA67_01905 [Micromonosporaceae bacterium]|nr:hypothetical protein [Micromonosporaceae bacterium]